MKIGGQFNLDNLQLVCKSWYTPAHIASLKSISLSDSEQLARFISSIDSNPDPRYLAAVKELAFSTPDLGSFDILEEQDIQNVFFRFPNLKSVHSYGGYALFERFDDRVCREFLNHCRKLETFTFTPSGDTSDAAYFDLVNRSSLLLTSLDMNALDQVTEYGGIVTFIKNFPRLRYLEGRTDLLDSFRHILAILETLPNFIKFRVSTSSDEDDMFAEKILSSKQEDIAKAIIQRLANVKELTWSCARNLCIHSAKFIAKYFTGLNVLHIHSCSSNDWNAQQAQAFTTTILDLLVSQPDCSLSMENLIVSSFSMYLPAIIAKMNDRMDSTKVLQVKLLQDDPDFEDTTLTNIRIHCRSGRFNPTIIVSVKHDELSIQQLASEVFGQITPLNDLDEFELKINDRLSDLCPESDFSMYNNLFKVFPSVKKMTLDIPSTFNEENSIESEDATCLSVEHLILRATKDADIYSDLFEKCCTAFPNLKRLEIYYFCGFWDNDRGEFYLHLEKCSLEHLVVDVTPLVYDTSADVESDYFVVSVRIDKKDRVFKIQKDFSAVSIINYERDLDGLYPGEDFLMIYIGVKHLDYLELHLNTASEFHEEEMYMHEYVCDRYSEYLSLSLP